MTTTGPSVYIDVLSGFASAPLSVRESLAAALDRFEATSLISLATRLDIVVVAFGTNGCIRAMADG